MSEQIEYKCFTVVKNGRLPLPATGTNRIGSGRIELIIVSIIKLSLYLINVPSRFLLRDYILNYFVYL